MRVPLESGPLASSSSSCCHPLPTPSIRLNQLLHGGLPPSTVTEIFGTKSTFKTQFVLTLAAKTVLEPAASVIVLDADAAFYNNRFAQILAARASTSEAVAAALARLHIIRSANWHSFVALLHLLPSVAARTGAKLLIVDSIATLFRTCDQPAPTKRLEAVSSRLHDLAVSMNLVVVVTNTARTDASNATISAMGDAWRHHTGTRILLQREPNIGANDDATGSAFIIKSILDSVLTPVLFSVGHSGFTDFHTTT